MLKALSVIQGGPGRSAALAPGSARACYFVDRFYVNTKAIHELHEMSPKSKRSVSEETLLPIVGTSRAYLPAR